MLFWLLLAMMTGAAMLSVLWPLSRARLAQEPKNPDLAVYLDQLREVERDRKDGRIPAVEAEAARIEVSRRVLSASEKSTKKSSPIATRNRRRTAAVFTFVGIPAIAVSVYLVMGYPEQSLGVADYRVESNDRQEVDMLIRRVESHLAEQPNDGRAWEVLAPVYLRLGRAAEAVIARTKALRLLGTSADREADLGEALVAEARGKVSNEAQAAFERARAIEKNHVKARLFIGLAAEQAGRKSEARAIWQQLATEAPSDAPWLPAVRAALARIEEPK